MYSAYTPCSKSIWPLFMINTSIEIEQTYTNLLQSSPLGLLHTSLNGLATFGSSTGTPLLVWSAAAPSIPHNVFSGNWQLYHLTRPPILHIWYRGAWPNTTHLCQAPYSTDMAPCDVWLFPKLKMPLKGKRFQSREGIMQNATEQLHPIPKEAKSLGEVCSSPRGLLWRRLV